jgi:hypothetical protein
MRTSIVIVTVVAAGCGGQPSVESRGSGNGRTPTPATTDEGGEPPTVATPSTEPARVAHPPIDCAGQEQITASEVEIVNGSGPGVRASGQCVVTLTSSVVRGSDYGVEATGDARVVLTDCRVTGAEAAVVVNGDANVRIPGTELVGELRLQGRAGAADPSATVSAMGPASP